VDCSKPWTIGRTDPTRMNDLRLPLLPYWFLFAIFAIGSLEYRRRGLIGSGSTPFLWAAGVFIAIMVGLRYQVGGDWITYEHIFEDFRYSDLATSLTRSDPGYSILNWIGHQFGYGIWFVNLVCAIVFAWGLVRFARRQPNPWLAILVGVPYLIIVVAMGYTRQGVALGFILAGLAIVDRSSVIRFSVYVLLAVTFHKSAIVVLPLVAMAATRNRMVTVGLFAVMAAMLYYFFVAASIDTLMLNYVEAEYTSSGAAVRIAMNIPPALLYLLFQRRFALDLEQRALWRNFSIAAIGCLALFLYLASSTVVDRLALYLIPLQLFVWSRLPEAFPDRRGANGQLVLVAILYSAMVQFTWLNYATHAEYWIPYDTYFL
jgi:hypothetical protein